MPGVSADLSRAVATVVERCLGVAAGEEVLVVADPDRADMGRPLHEAVLAAGGDGALVVVAPDPRRGTELPRSLAAALARADAYLAPCLPSISHTQARKAATEAGVRGATLPGVTEDLLARLMSADFDTLTRRSQAVAQLLTDATEAHLTCPQGTDLRLELTGRAGISDHGDLTTPGTAHVAFGASAAIGGTVAVPVHLDVVVLEPTVTVGGTTVVEAGRFIL